MAWGPNPNTEDELEKLAAVREYFHEQFPEAEIRDSYDTDRLAQVFRIQTNGKPGFRDAVLLTQFLDEYVRISHGSPRSRAMNPVVVKMPPPMTLLTSTQPAVNPPTSGGADF